MNAGIVRRRGKSGVAALVVAALLIVPIAALALTPKSGGYQGQTSQGRSVGFAVRGGDKVKALHFKWRANCSYGYSTGSTSISSPLPINNNGRFSYNSSGTTFTGKFTDKRHAKGTLSVSFTDYSTGGTCNSGRVSWNAHHL